MNNWKKIYKCLILVQSYIQRRVFVEQLNIISIVPAHRINTRDLSMHSTNIKERGDIRQRERERYGTDIR